MTAHSALGASSAHRWWNCPGSIRMSQGIEDRESVYAAEGTAAHELASTCLEKDKDADLFLGETFNGFEVTDEMAESVQLYLDTVRGYIEPGDEVSVEQRLDLSDIMEGMFGTCDVSIYKPAAKHLIGFDFKYGRGVPVEVVDNPQGLYYMRGEATRKHNRGVEKVTIGIVQPRCPHPDGPVRVWDVDPMYLLDWSADLRVAARRTLEPDAPLNAGDWCRFCPAAPTCPALRERVLEAARADFTEQGEIVLSEPNSFSSDDLGRLLLNEVDMIENWCRRIREYAHHEAEAGRMPTGMKLVAKRATRKFKDPDAALGHLKMFLSMDDEHIFKPKDMRSPAQIEAALKKSYGFKGKEAAQAIADLVESVSSGTVLAPLDDARAPARAEAAEDFAT